MLGGGKIVDYCYRIVDRIVDSVHTLGGVGLWVFWLVEDPEISEFSKIKDAKRAQFFERSQHWNSACLRSMT